MEKTFKELVIESLNDCISDGQKSLIDNRNDKDIEFIKKDMEGANWLLEQIRLAEEYQNIKNSVQLLNNHLMYFNGYIGSINKVSTSEESSVYYGQIKHVIDGVYYESDSVDNLKEEFKKTVTNYIEMLKEEYNGNQ